MIEKNKMEKIKKTLKTSPVALDSETRAIKTKGKKEHIKDLERSELLPGRVCAEMLTKLTMSDKLKDQLAKSWEEYLKEADKRKKSEMFNDFIKKYNNHTKALKIALGKFYQKEANSETKLTKAQEEIYNKLQDLKGKDISVLLSKYEEINQNDKFYLEKTKREAKEISKEGNEIDGKKKKTKEKSSSVKILETGEIQGADEGSVENSTRDRVFSQPGENGEDPLWLKHKNDNPDFYNVDEYRVEPSLIGQMEAGLEEEGSNEVAKETPDNIFLEAYRYLEMKNKTRNAYLKKEKPEPEEDNEDKPAPIKPPNPETIEPNPYPEWYPEKPKWDYEDFNEKKDPEYILESANSTEAPPKPNPIPLPEPKIDKIKLKTAFIAYDKEVAKIYARDIADKKMSEAYTPDRKKGFMGKVGNFFKRAFKYGVAREYYRQKEVSKAEQEILKRKNLFVDEVLSDEAQEKANKGILDRFVNIENIEDILHEGEKGKKLEDPKTKKEISELMKSYVMGKVDDANFSDCQTRIFEQIKKDNPDIFSEEIINANNLLESAKALKASFAHNQGIENLDIDVEIMIGNIKAGARTEQKLSGVDKIVDKVQKTKLGKMINETTLASALSITFGVAQQISQFFAFNKVAQAASFGGTALLAGALGASRERNYWEQKRRQHSRDLAVGKKANPEDKQRAILETYKYQSIDAKSTIGNLDVFEKGLDGVDTKEKAEQILNVIATLDARIKLSDSQMIDLISYSNVEQVEKERSAIDIKRATIKGKIKKLAAENGWKFGELDCATYLETATNANMKKIETEADGINEQNRKFAKLKNKQGMKAFGKGVVTGLVIGGLAQEGFAFLNPNQQGLVEQWVGKVNENATSQTALKHLADFVQDKISPGNAFAAGAVSGASYIENKPANISIDSAKELRIDSQGNYDLYVDGKLQTNNAISFDSNGAITPESIESMKNNGFLVDQTRKNISDVISNRTEISTSQFVENNSDMKYVAGTRDWMNNKTSGAYDLNELGTSIRSNNNNFVVDVGRMTSGGSFNQFGSVDIKEAIREGTAEIWVSFSRDTSAKVFSLPINANGLVEISPDSPVHQLFQNNGASASFNGGFLEVVAREAGNGGRNAILSTVEGSNILEKLIINTQTKVPQILDQIQIKQMPFSGLPFDYPPFIPIIPNRPLEPTMGEQEEGNEGQGPIVIPVPAQPKKPELPEPNKQPELKKPPTNPELPEPNAIPLKPGEANRELPGQKQYPSNKDDFEGKATVIEEDPIVMPGDNQKALTGKVEASDNNKEPKTVEKEKKEFLEKHKNRIDHTFGVIKKIQNKESQEKRLLALKDAIERRNVKDLVLVMLKSNYESMVFGRFDDKGYQDVWENANKKGKDIDIKREGSFLLRGKGLEKTTVDRCSLNVNVNQRVVDTLDQMIKDKEIDGLYKIGEPYTNASPKSRQDSVTIYFHTLPNEGAMKKIKELASKNARKNANELYAKGFRYTGMGEIKASHVLDMVKEKKGTPGGQAIEEFLTRDGRIGMSQLQFLATQKTLEQFGVNVDYTRDKGFTTTKL